MTDDLKDALGLAQKVVDDGSDYKFLTGSQAKTLASALLAAQARLTELQRDGHCSLVGHENLKRRVVDAEARLTELSAENDVMRRKLEVLYGDVEPTDFDEVQRP